MKLTLAATQSTSPSVYMVINTIYGYNTAGRAGPSGTSLVFPLDLNQVSTIDLVNSATRQLTLNDLGKDCPQTEAPSVIATAAPNGRCDPILVAPEPVKSWASPCNACGPFGMFDPPYAVAPLTGGLVPVTTTVAMTQPETQSTPSATPATDTTATPIATTTVAVMTESSYSSAEPTSPVVESSPSTSPVMETSSSSAESTSLVMETTSSQVDVTSSNVMPTTASSITGQAAGSSSSFSTVSSPATTSTAFNSASKESGRGAWLGLSLFAMAILL
ncbi:hypothetical protein N7523_006873 [Penicillium sp. IBT 18751x]|nr:hypothetical protein N7523_006873 [Penicillium sp. IBT 18751x]